tara:strand:- start:770 stop:1630 length:861 start_codon:yes stop_codon:yes gene_type:complete
MMKKHFVFSYTNILIREIEKRKYFSLLRKVFNIFYKLFVNFTKKKIGVIKNLDNQISSQKHNLSLGKLFETFNSDKGLILKTYDNKEIKSHNYAIFYEKYFKDLRNKKLRILEIGSHEGKGLAAFYYFFQNAFLIGANINPFQMKFYSKRIDEIYIDVSSKKILENFRNYFKEGFDIIIDDASHNLRDILITLPILFKKLNPGGFYVIEDIDQFKVFKNLNPTNEELTPLKILKHMHDKKEFQSDFISEEDIRYLKENISEYFFEKGEMVMNEHNISDIVFLRKNV